MKNMFKAVLLLMGLLAAPLSVHAQGQPPAKVNQPWFMLGKSTSPINVTSSSAATLLPGAGLTLWACNTGSNDAYLNFGNANTVVATIAGGTWLKASTCATYDLFPLNASNAYSYIAAIGNGGSTTIYIETGIGQPPAALSSSGGGGSGGAVFGPTAAGSAAANPPVIVGGTADGTGTGNVTNWKVLSGIGYVNCANCSGSGLAVTDPSTYTYSTSQFTPGGGFYQTTATTNPLTNGQQGMWQMTAQRAGFVNSRDSTGAENIGTTADSAYTGSGNATVISAVKGLYINSLLGTATNGTTYPGSSIGIGGQDGGGLIQPLAMSNWGTAPTGKSVQGVNANVMLNTNNVSTVPHICGSKAYVHISSATDTQIIPASGSTNIYICDFEASANGAIDFYIEKSSTGTCASPTQIGQIWHANAAGWGKAGGNSFYRGNNTGASQQLCVNTANGTGPLELTVFYDQY